MQSATESQYTQVLAWLIWIIVLLVSIRAPESNPDASASEPPVLTGIIAPHWRDGPLFPWQYRLRVIIRRTRRQASHPQRPRGSQRPDAQRFMPGQATQLGALRQQLKGVRAKIGQPYHRTVEAVRKRADTRVKKSPVGKFMRAEAYTDEQDQIRLRWWIDRHPFLLAQQKDGRYLLATSDWSLSPQRMFDLYRISKRDLKVSPIYLHKDERIEGMLLVNMLALLSYSLLERQARQNGWQMTTRCIIETLDSLDVIETLCWNGSLLYRIVPMDEEQAALLEILAQVLTDPRRPRWPPSLLLSRNILPLALPPPDIWRGHAAPEGAA